MRVRHVFPVLAGLCLMLSYSQVYAQSSAGAEPVVRLELRFSGSGITLGKTTRVEAPVRPYWGTAQLTYLFLEALGPKGEVVFARPLSDPRQHRLHRGDTVKPQQAEPAPPDEAVLQVDVPVASGARSFVIWAREADGTRSRRREMLKGGI